MSSFFKNQVNTTLAGLDWTAADSQETLRIMKGELKVKKRISFGMALAMVLLVLGMAFGIAEAIRYSVKDYHHLDAKTYQEHITAIEKEDKNEDVSFYLSDAVFDGERLVAAMEILPVSGEKVYLVPELIGESAGNTFAPHISDSSGGDFNSGFWVGKTGELGFTDGKYGFDAQVRKDLAIGTVNWKLTLHVLKPVWELVYDSSGYSDDSDGELDYDAWEKQFEDAYHNRKIMLVQQSSLMMFNTLLPGQESEPLVQRLIASGAFESKGKLQIDFTTSAVGSNAASVVGKTLEFDGFNIHIERLDVSFMRAIYAFTVNITDPSCEFQVYEGNDLINFRPAADGYSLRMVDSGTSVLNADSPKTGARFSGEFIGTGEMPDEITFKPYYFNNQGEPVYLKTGIFTVPLK